MSVGSKAATLIKAAQPEIRASGVVLLRRTDKGKTEICVLHRPSQKDWSLPKGKLDRGEHVAVAARRETLEETGEIVVLGVPLLTQRYKVERRAKSVRYWVGWHKAGGPGFIPNREIDELEWLSPNKAAKRLSYPRDVQLMRAAIDAPRTVPLIILRHTQAMRRSGWRQDDNRRPLLASGHVHARKLVPLLNAFGVEQLYSSDAVRCISTLQPFADDIAAAIRLEHLFSEIGFDTSKGASLKRLNRLIAKPEPLVLCTHRPVLPDLVAHIARKLGLDAGKHLDAALPPGGMIVLHRSFSNRGVQVPAIERHAL
jgi:8-oxo-(d)GTP phosphatase